MRPLPAWQLLAALFICMSTAAIAEPFGYAARFNELYRVNLANGDATRIGPVAGIGFNDVEALSFAPSGLLFGVVDATRILPGGSHSSTTDFLIRVSTTTGAGALVGQLPGMQGQGPGGNLDYGMGFGCDGRLWLSSATTGQFWQVNPVTADVSLVGNLGQPISGLAARGDILYGVSIDPQPRLYRIDVANATLSLVGPLNVGGVVSAVGLAFDADGQLWATLAPSNLTATRIARIDTASGAATVVASIASDVDFRSLAIGAPGGCTVAAPTPVPGPSLPVLLLLAGIAAAFGARRLSSR
jgi:hypothetical protein